MGAICHDCGFDTTPCTGKRGCRHKGSWEYYMVHDDVWIEAMGSKDGFLCVGCLERRLGRLLDPEDFTNYPVNWPSPWDTLRLADRKDPYEPEVGDHAYGQRTPDLSG